MRRNTLTLVTLLFSLAACGGGGGDGGNGNPTGPGPNTPQPNNPSTPPSNQVTVLDNEFSPAALTVAAGTTVTWSWAASNYASHNVTFADGVSNSTSKTSGTHQRAFTVAGSYAYMCSIHGSSMSGTITVAQ